MAYRGHSVLAVVPARSGSKGVPHKNLLKIAGSTLIARAGKVLSALPWIDARVISTDSAEYAAEGERHGLAAPFLRPAHLSTDTAGAVETMQHAVEDMEARRGARYDIVLIIEPTSPLRTATDLEAAVDLLASDPDAESVVTVSPVDPKCHPLKIFRVDDGRLAYYDSAGATIVARQQVEPLFARNGICYALTRGCLMEQNRIIGPLTRALVIDRPLVNIDGPLDVLLAVALLAQAPASSR